MKSNPLTAILLGVLGVSAAASLALCWSYSQTSRQIRFLHAQATAIDNRQMQVRAVLGEAYEYSKTHPQIDPLLEAMGVIKRQMTNAPGATATKPATK
jgi:hypothetical protein